MEEEEDISEEEGDEVLVEEESEGEDEAGAAEGKETEPIELDEVEEEEEAKEEEKDSVAEREEEEALLLEVTTLDLRNQREKSRKKAINASLKRVRSCARPSGKAELKLSNFSSEERDTKTKDKRRMDETGVKGRKAESMEAQ